MFFPDRVAGYREARRVLRPGGPFVFNVWDRIERSELTHLVTETVAAAFPDDPPRFLARLPHGYHAVDVIRADLQAAGFTEIVIETVALAQPGTVAAPPGHRLLPGHAVCAARSRRAIRAASTRSPMPLPVPSPPGSAMARSRAGCRPT